jgi:hypothetical protein
MIVKYKIISIYFTFLRMIGLVLPVLLLAACVQEVDAPKGKVLIQSEKTDPIRSWFEANKEILISRGQKGSESLRRSDNFLFPYIEKEIDWSQSLTFKFKDGREVVEFPVKSEQIPIPGFLVDSVGDKSKIKIKQSALFLKKKEGNDYSPVLVRFYTLGGDLDKVSYNQIPMGWNGIIEAFGMNDGHYITFTFKEGKMVSYSKIGADVTKNIKLRHENKRSNCYTLLVENPSYVLCVESIHDCTIYSAGTTPITYCIPDASFDPSDSEAGGDGSGGDGFCEGFDCYSFPGGESGGGLEEVQIIKDPSFEGTKADCVYEKLVNLSGGFKNAIKKFDGDFPVAHLRFKVDYDLADTTNAITRDGSEFLIEILFNGNTLNDRTILGLARTFLHEVIHAEMYRKVKSVNGSISETDFPGIYDYYRRHIKNWQHEQMASHYRNSIARMLQEFDTGIPLSSQQSPDQFYLDMSWVGLQKTLAWDNLDENEKIRIVHSIVYYESNGNKTCY